jgi:hypothetical protein
MNKQGIFFNVSQATWSMELFGKFSKKKLSHFEEKSYEIIKIFGSFGQISSLFLAFEITIF